MYLFINTANSDTITLALINAEGGVSAQKEIEARYKQSEKLLVEIEKLLEIRIKGLKDIKENLQGVIVVKGPGSFTALRIGVTTANTLAFAWRLPIVGLIEEGSFANQVNTGLKLIKNKSDFAPVLPEYGAEPNITLKVS